MPPPKLKKIGSPGVTAKKGSKGQFTCPICEDNILDQVGSKPGEDSIFCDGTCATWLHRRCAGLNKEAFKTICKSINPFYCPHCKLGKQDEELQSLRESVAELSRQVASITGELASLKNLAPFTRAAATGGSYARAVSNDQMAPSSGNTATDTTISPNLAPAHAPYERKFNLLIFGMKECSKGTLKRQRDQSDLDEVSQILSTVDPSMSSNSIHDYFRLGKYDPEKVRPILVKFIRSYDVASILSNRRNLASLPGISIKPDLTPEERKVESLLLKERRSLIDAGVERRDIQLKGNSLLVNKAKHGYVVNSEFKRTSKPLPPAETDQSEPTATTTNDCDVIPQTSMTQLSSPSPSPQIKSKPQNQIQGSSTSQ